MKTFQVLCSGWCWQHVIRHGVSTYVSKEKQPHRCFNTAVNWVEPSPLCCHYTPLITDLSHSISNPEFGVIPVYLFFPYQALYLEISLVSYQTLYLELSPCIYSPHIKPSIWIYPLVSILPISSPVFEIIPLYIFSPYICRRACHVPSLRETVRFLWETWLHVPAEALSGSLWQKGVWKWRRVWLDRQRVGKKPICLIFVKTN